MKLHPDLERILNHTEFNTPTDKSFIRRCVEDHINKITDLEERIKVLHAGIRQSFNIGDIVAIKDSDELLAEVIKVANLPTNTVRTDENKMNWIKNLIGDGKNES